MDMNLYTEADLAALRSMPKRVENPRTHWLKKPQARPVHRQRNFRVAAESDDRKRFLVYQRQNLDDDSDFSCGILYLPRDAVPLTLARYNGPGHEHGSIAWRPHIHRATEEAIAAGRKPESDAEETSRFESVEGALACLIEDFNVTGIASRRDDEPRFL